jgi:hypothetical protein
LAEYTNSAFTLVVYAAGNASGQGATLTLTGATGGNSASTLTTTATSRQISAGLGVAYNVFTGFLTNGTLTLTATKNSGQSYVIVDGFQLWLSPYSDPSITTQPVSQTTMPSNTVSFGVGASGTGPLSCQWQAGAVGSGLYTNLVNGPQISGAASNSLTIANVTANWALAYRVVVTNSFGSVTSAPAAILTVNIPAIGLQPNGAGGFVLTWSGGSLLQATNLLGPWSTNSGATSPFTNTPGPGVPQQFYRVGQ